MTVTILENGVTGVFNASYACRLIEQGRAVPVPEKKKNTRRKAEVTEDVSEGQDHRG